jgi:hypothetical protein
MTTKVKLRQYRWVYDKESGFLIARTPIYTPGTKIVLFYA